MAAFIMLVRSVLTFCGPIMGLTLIALGHNKAPLRINVVVTTFTFLSSYFLIPYWGYMGVVYVAIVGSVIGFTLNWLYIRYSQLKVDLGRNIVPIAASFVLFI